MSDLYALFRQSLAGLRLLVAATVAVGVVYPLVVWGFGAVAAPWQANGSLVTATGERTTDPKDAVGSALVGQLVEDDALFRPRPSAAGEGYDMRATFGSNLGPESPDLVASIEERRAAVAELEGVREEEVPPDALTASGSGLDPHISVAYAQLQVPRVARANGLTTDQVRAVVEQHTSLRTWGVLGEPRVNVLTANLGVRRLAGA